jgi:hypothetical protein
MHKATACSLALLTAVVAMHFAPLGADAGFLDLGHDGYQLREVLDLLSGAHVFRDTFDQYGPLAPLFNVAGFLALGHTLLAVKYFIALWYGVSAAALYAVSRHLLGPALSAGTVLAWLALAPFYQQGVMISPHAYASLVQCGAMLAMLAYLKTPRIGWLILAGSLCGVTCLLKQSIGALTLSSFVAFLLIAPMTGGQTVRRVSMAIAALLAGCVAILTAAAVVLLASGSLHDWYLQTIAFPRTFYLSYYGETGNAGAGRAAAVLVRRFVALQIAAEPVWAAMRLVAIGGAIVAVARRDQAREPLVLAGCASAVLWLGAFPSATVMHQWWTAIFAVPAAIAVGRGVIAKAIAYWSRPLVADALTALIVVLLIAPSVVARERDAHDRAARLTISIVTPPILAGIRTDPVTAGALTTLYQTMVGYRTHHPGTPVASIDDADGISGRVAESLPLLSVLPDNRHPSPVYWRLPVLSTAIYPDYDAVFANFIRTARPLLVDARRTGEAARVVPGYYVLAAEPSPAGHWLLYAPDHAERIAHGEPPVKFDEPSLPPLVEYVALAGRDGSAQARAYVWPATATRSIDRVPWSRNAELGPAVFTAPQLRRQAGALMVDGPIDSPYSYLLQLQNRHLRAGDYFYAQGDLLDGGLTIGLQSRDQWIGAVNVVRHGRFAVLIAAPDDGDYELVIANCVTPTWWQRLAHRGRVVNTFRIETAGWTGAL